MSVISRSSDVDGGAPASIDGLDLLDRVRLDRAGIDVELVSHGEWSVFEARRIAGVDPVQLGFVRESRQRFAVRRPGSRWQHESFASLSEALVQFLTAPDQIGASPSPVDPT